MSGVRFSFFDDVERAGAMDYGGPLHLSALREKGCGSDRRGSDRGAADMKPWRSPLEDKNWKPPRPPKGFGFWDVVQAKFWGLVGAVVLAVFYFCFIMGMGLVVKIIVEIIWK